MSDTFYTAVICEKGHVLNATLESSADYHPLFCGRCGSNTLVACRTCQAPLHGKRVGVLSGRPLEPDRFCTQCGAAYPWTAIALSAFQEEVDSAGVLTAAEKAELVGAADAIVRETVPSTRDAVRFRSLAKKAGPLFLAATQSILETVVAPALVRRILGP